MLSQTQKDKLS